MAGVRCLHCNWRKNGHCHFCNQEIFYLHFFPYTRVSCNILFIFSFLDERKKLYPKFKA